MSFVGPKTPKGIFTRSKKTQLVHDEPSSFPSTLINKLDIKPDSSAIFKRVGQFFEPRVINTGSPPALHSEASSIIEDTSSTPNCVSERGHPLCTAQAAMEVALKIALSLDSASTTPATTPGWSPILPRDPPGLFMDLDTPTVDIAREIRGRRNIIVISVSASTFSSSSSYDTISCTSDTPPMAGNQQAVDTTIAEIDCLFDADDPLEIVPEELHFAPSEIPKPIARQPPAKPKVISAEECFALFGFPTHQFPASSVEHICVPGEPKAANIAPANEKITEPTKKRNGLRTLLLPSLVARRSASPSSSLTLTPDLASSTLAVYSSTPSLDLCSMDTGKNSAFQRHHHHTPSLPHGQDCGCHRSEFVPATFPGPIDGENESPSAVGQTGPTPFVEEDGDNGEQFLAPFSRLVDIRDLKDCTARGVEKKWVSIGGPQGKQTNHRKKGEVPHLSFNLSAEPHPHHLRTPSFPHEKSCGCHNVDYVIPRLPQLEDESEVDEDWGYVGYWRVDRGDMDGLGQFSSREDQANVGTKLRAWIGRLFSRFGHGSDLGAEEKIWV